MNKFFITLASFSALLLSTSAFTGCDSADEAFDCQSICQRYSDCFDSEYDVSACADNCRDMAADSEAYSDKADNCETCIDDRSCTESFACVSECVGVVP